MSTVIILRESAIEKIVKTRALRSGCSPYDAVSGALAAISVYRKNRNSAHRAIQYGITYARLLADIDGPQTAA